MTALLRYPFGLVLVFSLALGLRLSAEDEGPPNEAPPAVPKSQKAKGQKADGKIAVKNEAPIEAAESAPPGKDFIETPAQPTSTDKVGVKLTELFGTESTPGSGFIGYTLGTSSQQVNLGKETGIYAMGLVFEGIDLPQQIKKGIEKQVVIQLAIGVNRSKLAGQIPQFGAMTILSLDTPVIKKIYPFVVPNPKDKGRKEMAFLLFSPPNTPAERTDEEKLKSTYFANNGVMSLDPKGGTQVLEVKRNGERLKFSVRFMEAEIDGGLSTPFSAEPGRLRGKFKFPLYWPSNLPARKLVQKMARDSLEGGSIDRFGGPQRGVSGEK